jgi:mRNA interferase HigB
VGKRAGGGSEVISIFPSSRLLFTGGAGGSGKHSTSSQNEKIIGPESRLHVISRKRLLEAARRHAELGAPLDVWYRIARRASWKNLQDVREAFPSADGVGRQTVFNIKGNSYRLMVEINYKSGRIFIRDVLTHAEYDRGGWK